MLLLNFEKSGCFRGFSSVWANTQLKESKFMCLYNLVIRPLNFTWLLTIFYLNFGTSRLRSVFDLPEVFQLHLALLKVMLHCSSSLKFLDKSNALFISRRISRLNCHNPNKTQQLILLHIYFVSSIGYIIELNSDHMYIRKVQKLQFYVCRNYSKLHIHGL